MNNLLVATQLIAVSEAITIGRRWGVEPGALLTAVNASSGRSAVSEVNFPRWILNAAFDSGFSMRIMRKDVAAAIALGTSETPAGASSSEGYVLLQTAAAMWRDSVTRLSDEADFNRMGQLPADVE